MSWIGFKLKQRGGRVIESNYFLASVHTVQFESELDSNTPPPPVWIQTGLDSNCVPCTEAGKLSDSNTPPPVWIQITQTYKHTLWWLHQARLILSFAHAALKNYSAEIFRQYPLAWQTNQLSVTWGSIPYTGNKKLFLTELFPCSVLSTLLLFPLPPTLQAPPDHQKLKLFNEHF